VGSWQAVGPGFWPATQPGQTPLVKPGKTASVRFARVFRRRGRGCDGQGPGIYRIRLNQSSDRPADAIARTAATSANRPEISVSFFSRVSRELSFS